MVGLRVEAGVRNSFEAKIDKQFEVAGIDVQYEPFKLDVAIPARIAKYLPDWHPRDTNILVEGKGLFGGKHASSTSAAARKKMALFKEQHSEWDLRFIFQNARAKIYKGSKTTYADWAESHGFKWSDRGLLPREWITEIKEQQREHNRNPKRSARRVGRTGGRNGRDVPGRRRRV